ncbi:MAG: hypothetical protein Q4C06_03310 [Bacillota bacterium]|nr:hypothetical protein [Bacillota bacterium]
MKIEMGESLLYSWLRHVKKCQIVQMNWKVSPQWTLNHEEELQKLMNASNEFFCERYNFHIYKQNRSLNQLMKQGECDVFGLAVREKNGIKAYAVDVAFHEAGLNYGSHAETVMRVMKKCLRTAMCLYGYLNLSSANIIFASPKINPIERNALLQGAKEVEKLLQNYGLDYSVQVIANEEFNSLVLQPILAVSNDVSDTSELFLRSYQMYKMFAEKKTVSMTESVPVNRGQEERVPPMLTKHDFSGGKEKRDDPYQKLKVGQLANTVLRKILVNGHASAEEIKFMQTAEYSKQFFGLNFPLLVRGDTKFEGVRYYKEPLLIDGIRYYMCSQWFEVPTNDDRPYLLRWIASHEHKKQ